MKHIFLGLGRMGVAQARLARRFGDQILAGIDCDGVARSFFTSAFGVYSFSTPAEVPKTLWKEVDIVWIVVTDRAIADCANDVAPYVSHAVVIHTSGVTPYTVLGNCGASRGSMHPLMSCPRKDDGDGVCFQAFRSAVHAIDGEPEAIQQILSLTARLEAKVVHVDPVKRGAYHAAAVFASNYPVVLIDAAQKLFLSCGFDEALARQASVSLLSQTVRALSVASPCQALTGPAKRGDLQTIERHIDALKAHNYGEFVELYNALLRAVRAMCR